MGLLGICCYNKDDYPCFFGSGNKEDYLDAEPKGLSFSILSTSIILQRAMLTLDLLLLRSFTPSLNKEYK